MNTCSEILSSPRARETFEAKVELPTVSREKIRLFIKGVSEEIRSRRLISEESTSETWLCSQPK